MIIVHHRFPGGGIVHPFPNPRWLGSLLWFSIVVVIGQNKQSMVADSSTKIKSRFETTEFQHTVSELNLWRKTEGKELPVSKNNNWYLT